MPDGRLAVLLEASVGHPFRTSGEAYLTGFLAALDHVYGHDRWEEIARNKFGIASDHFSDEVYLAHASELSVQYGVSLSKHVERVEHEKRVNPPKDVDCYYEVLGTKVALDVKCAHSPKIPPNSVVQWTDGRLPASAQKNLTEFAEALSRAPGIQQVAVAQKKDNSLKDFLISGQKKFVPDPTAANFNVIFIACGAPFDVMTWHHFLFSWQGLFTRESFCDPKEYDLVDAVILSNLKDVHTRKVDARAWTLQDTFVLPLLSPFSRRASLNADAGLRPFDHHMQPFREYLRDVTHGENGDVLRSTAVLHYIENILPLEQRERYFGPRVENEEPS